MKLTPSPDAEPSELIRRLYLDLIGVPPSPLEVDRYCADPTDEAYAAIVDELLQRPQFGERWARPWLDLARYADSHGFQRDNLRDVWPYRDWVIRAMNEDMPFSQFTIEQIAGDLLPEPTESQRIATGFHRCAPTNVEAGSLPEETRTEQVIDRVNTTAAVWLGTTLECAQCHDHKYDPFTMRDYYQLLAFFDSTEREADRANPKQASSIQFLGPYMPVANPEIDRQRAERQAAADKAKQAVASHRQSLAEELVAWAESQRERLKQQGNGPTEHLLEVVAFESQAEGNPHQLLDDGSVLLEGQPPATDVYRVKLRAPKAQEEIRAIKVEALRHDLLPGKGPGRGDPKRRNFILSEVTGSVGGKAVKFTEALTDFSQDRWPVANAIDGDTKTGWAISPQFDRSHWARFTLAEPLRLADDATVIELVLSQQYGTGRTIGCVRFSAITGTLDGKPLPGAVAKLLKRSPDTWTAAHRKFFWTIVLSRIRRPSSCSKCWMRQTNRSQVLRAIRRW